jgi:glycosyltransferase involved in cell wall biosynthesis
MKILVVTPYFFPKIGGVENYVYHTSKGLKDKYHNDVIVLTSNHIDKHFKVEHFENIIIYRLPYWFKLSNTPINPFWFIQIKYIIKKIKPDLIIAHSPVPFLADLVILTNKNIPIILTYHCGSLKKEKGFIINIFLSFYEKYILQYIISKVDYLICSSDFVRNKFLQKYKSKSTTITPGVDVRIFKAPQNMNNNHLSVLYVGRIDISSEWKGLSYLLDSFAMVHKVFPQSRLSIVGDGDGLANQIQYAEKLHIRTSVDFLGALQGKKLAEQYQKSTLLVLPSITEAESFGIVLIEAMACKKPVIGSNVGGIPYVIDDHMDGILVPPKDSFTLAKKIIQILQNPDLARRMGQNGYDKVVNNYTWNSKIISIQNLIQTMIHK